MLSGLDCTTDAESQDQSTHRAVTGVLGDTEAGSPGGVFCSHWAVSSWAHCRHARYGLFGNLGPHDALGLY